MMNHPLALPDDDDDDYNQHGNNIAASNLRVVESSSLSSSTTSTISERRSKATSEESMTGTTTTTTTSSPIIDAQTAALANIIRSKCGEKRMAPKAPSLTPFPQQPPQHQAPPPTLPRLSLLAPLSTPVPSPRHDLMNNHVAVISDEFLIPVEHVRWFYKTEKEKHLNHGTAEPPKNANTESTTTTTSTSNSTSCDPNNNNTVDSKLIVVKKWEMFSKWDSINLETEYRKMRAKRKSQQQDDQEEDVLVQVQNNMYEVNLKTRKCYPIYLKSGRKMKVQRCLWYRDTNEPFDERVCDEIERRHVELFRDVLLAKLSGDPLPSPATPVSVVTTVAVDEPTEVVLVDSSSFSSSSTGGSKTSVSTTKSGKSDTPKIQIEPLSSLIFEDGTITWFSESEVFLEKSKTVLDKMSDLLKYNKSKISSGTKIKRGYIEKQQSKDAENDEKPPKEITHLVFVVHGIAQKLYENSIIKSCEDLSKECEKQKKEQFGNYAEQRYIFIPVDWRTSLTLDDGVIESITPKSIQAIRDKLNASLLDIMYYTSPLFKIEILNSLASETNRLYHLFCQKNPTFKEKHNKVSIIAHSLGTVIIYDILTSNDFKTLLNSDGAESNQDKMLFEHYASNHNHSLLDEYTSCRRRMQEIEKILVSGSSKAISFDFKTDSFFLLGSPLAVFLTLRGLRPGGSGSQDHILPKRLCSHIFNIFHPSDPVAYRLEPLILKHYTSIGAVEMPRVSEVAKKGIQYEKRTTVDADLKSSLTYKPSSAAAAIAASSSSGGGHSSHHHKKKEKDLRSAELTQIKDDNAMVCLTKATSSSSNTSNSSPATIDKVELEENIDYQLQEGSLMLLETFKAHSCYWKSPEVALLIMNFLCLNDARDKNSVISSTTTKSKI